MKNFLLFVLVVCIKQVNAQVSFTPVSFFSTGFQSQCVTSADFNGDGKADLATSNQFADSISVLLGDGLGGFSPVSYFTINALPQSSFNSIISADFNGDGKPDLATVSDNTTYVSVLLGTGTGSFSSAINYSYGVTSNHAQSITSTDFNGDGFIDLAIAADSVYILFGTGTGSFSTEQGFSIGTSSATYIISVDFNGDLVNDLAVAIGIDSIRVLLGTGLGSFGIANSFYIGSATYLYSIASADFNGDGKADLATANVYGGNISILLGNGYGGFAPPTFFTAGSYPYAVIPSDFNQDGKVDLAIINSSNNISIRLGNGAGGFTNVINFVTGSSSGSIISTDFNGDGYPDLATTADSYGVGVLLYSFQQGIIGYIYKDTNSNCIKDGIESTFKNVPMKIYDNNNNFIGQTYSSISPWNEFIYFFSEIPGTYKVVIDTSNMPFVVQCAHPGLDSTVMLNNNVIDSNINFSITCKNGFDLGAQYLPPQRIRSGQQFPLYSIIGETSRLFNLSCVSGLAGQVNITVTSTAALTYVGPAPGSLTPTVNGNTYIYSVPDFDVINNATDFNLIFNIVGGIGDSVCVNIVVTPTIGDYNATNNNLNFCFQVFEPQDPNFKEVSPINVQPYYNDWFTYIIHFQNTGTASAINVRLTDKLDSNLDLSTFQVVNYSHNNTVLLNGDFLTFKFPNINLPDSGSNFAGSQGYVQYRIKPKANLPAGTQIKNTANIYFDFNQAVITNTTINTFLSTTSVNQTSVNNQTIIYPNPSRNSITIQSKTELGAITIYNVLGEIVVQTKSKNTQEQIDISKMPIGVYTVQTQGRFSKLIKE